MNASDGFQIFKSFINYLHEIMADNIVNTFGQRNLQFWMLILVFRWHLPIISFHSHYNLRPLKFSDMTNQLVVKRHRILTECWIHFL